MAKTPSKSSGTSSRPSVPAKSAKAPARPSAKTVPGKLPPRTRPAPAKAVVAKTPAAKAPARKAPPAKTTNARARAAVVEKSPASEEEIISAVAGKLTTRTGGGMTWLSAKAAKIETVEITMEGPTPEPAIPVEAVVVEEAAPAEASSAAEPVAGETVTADPVVAEAAPAPEEAAPPQAEVISDIAGEVAPDSVVTEAVAEETAAVSTAAPETAAAAVPSPEAVRSASPAKPAPSAEAFTQALATASRQLGWALTVQALTFIAFCVLVKGGVPASGLPQVLAAVIPLFAMILAVASYLSFHGTRRLLDQLEHDRAQSDAGHPHSSFGSARLFAHLPALVILGFLVVVWFIIGATVWWL